MAGTPLQQFLALVPPQITNADPTICRLTDWVMTVSVAWVDGGTHPNRLCRVGAPSPEKAPACLPGQPFWDEAWDGTLAALRDLRDRAQAENDEDGSYVVIALERDWEAIEGSWGETANMVAVFPAVAECVDRTEGNDLNVGLRAFLARLDAAHLQASAPIVTDTPAGHTAAALKLGSWPTPESEMPAPEEKLERAKAEIDKVLVTLRSGNARDFPKWDLPIATSIQHILEVYNSVKAE